MVDFIVGFFVGALLMLGSTLSIMGEHSDMAKSALIECEKELPRNQNCKIIAIPEDQNETNN